MGLAAWLIPGAFKWSLPWHARLVSPKRNFLSLDWISAWVHLRLICIFRFVGMWRVRWFSDLPTSITAMPTEQMLLANLSMQSRWSLSCRKAPGVFVSEKSTHSVNILLPTRCVGLLSCRYCSINAPVLHISSRCVYVRTPIMLLLQHNSGDTNVTAVTQQKHHWCFAVIYSTLFLFSASCLYWGLTQSMYIYYICFCISWRAHSVFFRTQNSNSDPNPCKKAMLWETVSELPSLWKR